MIIRIYRQPPMFKECNHYKQEGKQKMGVYRGKGEYLCNNCKNSDIGRGTGQTATRGISRDRPFDNDERKRVADNKTNKNLSKARL